MFRQRIILLSLIALFFVVPASLASQRIPQEPPLSTSQIPIDQIIIQFNDDSTLNRQIQNRNTAVLMQTLSTEANITLSYKRAMSGNAHVLSLPTKMAVSEVETITARLEALNDVAYAEPDRILQIIKQPEGQRLTIEATPNDPFFSNQWHYRYSTGTSEGINAESAWDITTGAPTVVVAVIDTGILPSHPDLANQIIGGYDFISDTFVANDGNGRDADASDPGDWVSANACFSGSDASNSSWHGSHVAGTIGAETDNGTGVSGISWNSKILPIRALGRCGGSISDIADGIVWSAGGSVNGVPANSNPAQVINMSLGGQGACSQTEQIAINTAVNLGASIVTASGNSAADAVNFSPGNCNNVINVASNDRTGDLSFYSNYSTTLIDVSAPGGETTVETNGVLSTVDSSTTSPSTPAYAYYQGTSMAAPHVAGVAGLMYAINPGITPAQVEQVLKDTARDFPAGSSCLSFNDCGAGIIDATAAVNNACSVSSKNIIDTIIHSEQGSAFEIFLPLIRKSC